MIHVKAKASPREIYTKGRKWRAKTLCKHYFYTIHHKKVGNYFAKSLTHKSRIIPFAIAEVVYLASKPHYTWNIYRKMKSNQSPHNRTAMNPLKGLTIRTISGLFLSPAKRGVANRLPHRSIQPKFPVPFIKPRLCKKIWWSNHYIDLFQCSCFIGTGNSLECQFTWYFKS